MALPVGNCLLPLELCSYPRNGPLPTVSPLDSYELQDVFASNWMSDFIASFIPLPPAANDKQEHVLLLLDTRAWEKSKIPCCRVSVQGQENWRKDSHRGRPADAI